MVASDGGGDAAAQHLENLAGEVIGRGLRRIHVLAWRDLDDPDAGGSEVHADEFMRRWAEAGLEVTHRTSAAVELPHEDTRNGYRVIRRGGRYSVFPRTFASEIAGRMGPYDALVEIWNGVPWFSPIWARKPNVTFIHHVHGPMWDQIFPRPVSDVGRLLETRIAPPAYRRTPILTPSESTREELLEVGFRPDRVQSVPNGVESFFSPGGSRSPDPLVIAVGRQAPVKRYAELITQVDLARQRVPNLRLQLLGDGPERPDLLNLSAGKGWIDLPGRVGRDELLDAYRSAWLVVSASLAEGWGLSLTEGAACGTPCVATDISGHRSSVHDGETGVLVPLERLGDTIAAVLLDAPRREALGGAARDWAQSLSWDAVAQRILETLAEQIRGASGTGR